MPKTRLPLLATLLAIALPTAPLSAQTGDFYRGKTVTIIVGFTAGGGYDLYARAFARHLADHIPDHPTVIVQNMPGASGILAARSLNSTQPKDGTVMLTFDPGLVTQSIVRPETVNVDFRRSAWIGSITPTFRVCYGFGPDGVKSWNDMMHRKEFVLGAVAKGGSDYINGATLREVFGAPVKQVLGFPGSAEEVLAVERGELDGECGSLSSIPAAWLRDGRAHPFVRFNKEKPSEMPDSARYIEDFANSKDQKDLLAVLDADAEIGRAYIMSGDVPADRVATMRAAFDATMKDPAFLADMEKQQFPVHPVTGDDTARIVAKLSAVPPAVIDKAKQIY